MSRQVIGARIREKLEKKMASLQDRLAEVEDVAEMKAQLVEVEADILAVEAELEAQIDAEALPGIRTRLEGQHERLLAQKARIELRMALLQEKRERLQETLDELKTAYAQHAADTPAPPDPRKSWEVGVACALNASKNLEDERRKILEMLQAGKITVDDATRLLEAAGEQETRSQARRRPRWVRIRVTDTDTNRVRVNLTLPIGLVKAGLRAGGSIAGIEGLNTAGLEDLLNRGEVGHFFDAYDDKDGERVEVFVE